MDCQNETRPEENVAYSKTGEQYMQKTTTAMVLSIVGMALFFLPVVNLASLALSIIGFHKARENRTYAMANDMPENGRNTAAYVCGLIGIILAGASILLTLLGLMLFGFITTTVVTAVVPTAGALLGGILPVA